MQHAWTVEVEETIVISHPAWRGLEHHTVSPASYIDHTIQVRRFFLVRRKGLTSDCSQLLKIMWESDLRQLLPEPLISRAACEWILECLFDIARVRLPLHPPLAHAHPLRCAYKRKRKRRDPNRSSWRSRLWLFVGRRGRLDSRWNVWEQDSGIWIRIAL